MSVAMLPVWTDQVAKSPDSVTCGPGEFTVDGLRAMALGLRRFTDAITGHQQWTATKPSCTDSEVLDSWPEKLSAWRAALYVSSVVLQADLEIVGTSSSPHQSFDKCSREPGRVLVGRL